MTAINPSVPRRVEPFRMRRPHLQWQMHTLARSAERGLQVSSVFFVKLDAETFRTPARKARFSPRLASIGAERTPVREHRSDALRDPRRGTAKTKAKPEICGRRPREAIS